METDSRQNFSDTPGKHDHWQINNSADSLKFVFIVHDIL